MTCDSMMKLSQISLGNRSNQTLSLSDTFNLKAHFTADPVVSSGVLKMTKDLSFADSVVGIESSELL